MNFDRDPADESFRADIKAYLGKTLLEMFADQVRPGGPTPFYGKPAMQRWTRALDARSLLVPHWPREMGGSNWPPNWRRILGEELAAISAPPTDTIGTDFVGPVLCAFGSPAQKARYLPAIRNGEQFWCQGFSEPGAGSDVMSLCTTAHRDRENYIVKGRKLWTSNAHNADMMFALLRIEVPGVRRQQGLSFLLIDMRSPGVTVRPVIMIDGRRWVNEVTLDNVQVPITNLVGEPGKGWVYARFLLANERAVVAGLGHIKSLIANLRKIAAARCDDGSTRLDDPVFVAKLSQLEAELHALDFMELRLLHSRTDESVVQFLAPILKLHGSELRQRVTDLTLQAIGEPGLELPFHGERELDTTPCAPAAPAPFVRDAIINYLFQRSATLAGGTSEIQRNLIAGIALQL